MDVVKSVLVSIGVLSKPSSSEESETSLSSEEENSSESNASTESEALSDREFARGDLVEAKFTRAKYMVCEILKYDYGRGFVIKFTHNGHIINDVPRKDIRSVRKATLKANNPKFARGDRVEALRRARKAQIKPKKKLSARQALLLKHKRELLQGNKKRQQQNANDNRSGSEGETSFEPSSESDSDSDSSAGSSSSSSSDEEGGISSSEDEEEIREREMAINKNREKISHDPDFQWSHGVVTANVPNADGSISYRVRWTGTAHEDVVPSTDIRAKFKKHDKVEGKLEGWAEYYTGEVKKYHKEDNTYTVEFEDGEVGVHVSRNRLREVGDTKDVIGRAVSDEFQQKRREYVMALKSRNYARCLEMIVEEGIHPDHEDPLTGTNALVRACLSGKHKWAIKFVEEGADVNYQTLSGLTPIIACAEKGSLRCLKAIMFDPFDRPLANPWKKNRLGKTGWDVARERKKQGILDYLDEIVDRPGYKDALENYTVVDTTKDLVKEAARLAAKAARAAELAIKNSPAVRERAAREIQKWIRKVMNRRRFQICVMELIARRRREVHKQMLQFKKNLLLSKMALKVQRRYRVRMAKRRADMLRSERDAAMLLQRLMLRMINRMRAKKRMEQEHLAFLNWEATRIQAAYRGHVAFTRYNDLYEATIVIQMLWRGREGRDMYLRELIRKKQEEEFNRRHLDTVAHLQQITEELRTFLYFEQARVDRYAVCIIEKYFTHWLFLLRRQAGAINIQRAWRGFVARHISKVLLELNRKRYEAMEKCLTIDQMHLRMSPMNKKQRKVQQKMQLTLKDVPSPSLERVNMAGLDPKLVMQMVGFGKVRPPKKRKKQKLVAWGTPPRAPDARWNYNTSKGPELPFSAATMSTQGRDVYEYGDCNELYSPSPSSFRPHKKYWVEKRKRRPRASLKVTRTPKTKMQMNKPNHTVKEKEQKRWLDLATLQAAKEATIATAVKTRRRKSVKKFATVPPLRKEKKRLNPSRSTTAPNQSTHQKQNNLSSKISPKPQKVDMPTKTLSMTSPKISLEQAVHQRLAGALVPAEMQAMPVEKGQSPAALKKSKVVKSRIIKVKTPSKRVTINSPRQLQPRLIETPEVQAEPVERASRRPPPILVDNPAGMMRKKTPFMRLKLVKSNSVDDKRPDTAEEDRITPRHVKQVPYFIDVDSLQFTIGRAENNRCMLDSQKKPKMLSKEHAKISIVLSQDGLPRMQLMDLGSTNGTYMNGKRVVKNKPVDLFPGSIVKFGRRKTSDLIYEVIVPGEISEKMALLAAKSRASSPLGKLLGGVSRRRRFDGGKLPNLF
eukprot:Stramenopile-MAST_4_protein_663